MPRSTGSTVKRAASAGGRSVNYPLITLQAAIGQVRKLWDSAGKNSVLIPTAGIAWGYGERSSGLRSTVSALKQYGLLQDVGEGEKRQISLTHRALDLLVESTASPKHQEAIRAALLAPKIYREIFDRFQAGLPAQDHAISSFLLREKDFNRKTVPGFITVLRANFQFAGFPQSDSASPPSDLGAPKQEPGSTPLLPEQRPGAGVNRDVYALGVEGEAVFQWPAKISQASYDELAAWLELQLKKIARLNGLKRHRDTSRR